MRYKNFSKYGTAAKFTGKAFTVAKAIYGAKTRASDVDRIIQVEISKAGMKPDYGFQKALDGYVAYHKIKGIKADMVKAYVAKAAISIAQSKKGKYDFGIKSNLVKPSDVQAAVYWLHPPPVSMDDPCEDAIEEIISMEKARAKGSMGKLSPVIVEYLDKLKS